MKSLMTNTGSTEHALTQEQMEQPARQTAGLLVEDIASRRLLDGILTNLDLDTTLLEDADLVTERLFQFEMIVADAETARRIRPLITEQQASGEKIKPALVAIVAAPYTASSQKRDSEDFDAVIAMPERPALLNAQLGVALYAHRAFAQRYQSALEELNLNRNIFKSVTSGISVANAQLPDMPLMYVNPAFEVMSGYTLEEVEGKNCRFLQNGDADQPGLTLIREALAQQRETLAVVKNYRKDGTLFWNELALSPIRNRDGVLTHFVGIQMDVTERVELETALREAEKLAAVGRLASAISHEINNPLEADMELQRIKLITAQSLRFYKQSHGPEAITCDALLAPILDIYQTRFTNYKVHVSRRSRSTQHIVCLASEIRQVATNLLTNAVDAMRDGGGTLYVRTREATDWHSDRKGVVLTIADTGVGIARELLANIYKAFYTTKGANGTGLGLWISSEIVQRHHGRLCVRSSQNPKRHGTVFQLFLPFQAASGEATAVEATL